jgi:hypothetical protein
MNVTVLPWPARFFTTYLYVRPVGHPGQRVPKRMSISHWPPVALVVVELARDPEPLEREHHLGSQVVKGVVGAGPGSSLLGRSVYPTPVDPVPVPSESTS